MPKLLSEEEVIDISSKMAEEYGLPPIIIEDSSLLNGYSSALQVKIIRYVYRPRLWWFPWLQERFLIKMKEFYAQDYEDILVRLQYELSRFDSRTKIAEQFREKYALQEANKALDDVLREK